LFELVLVSKEFASDSRSMFFVYITCRIEIKFYLLPYMNQCCLLYIKKQNRIKLERYASTV
jgi:hypothetical protein